MVLTAIRRIPLPLSFHRKTKLLPRHRHQFEEEAGIRWRW